MTTIAKLRVPKSPEWKCEICGGVGREGSPLPESCEIPERSIGNECLAMRQLELAKRYVAEKDTV